MPACRFPRVAVMLTSDARPHDEELSRRPRITIHGEHKGKANYPRAVATFRGLELSCWRPDGRSSYGFQGLDSLNYQTTAFCLGGASPLSFKAPRGGARMPSLSICSRHILGHHRRLR